MNVPGSAVLLLIISVLLCVPPFMMLRLCARFYRRALRHRLQLRRYLIAFCLALLAFSYNLGTFVSIGYSVSTGGEISGPFRSIAVAIAWIAFWGWLFLSFGLGRDIARRREPPEE